MLGVLVLLPVVVMLKVLLLAVVVVQLPVCRSGLSVERHRSLWVAPVRVLERRVPDWTS